MPSKVLSTKRDPLPKRTCAAPDCDVEFVPERTTAEYHSATCRQRAARARKAAERQAAEEEKTDRGAEHGLVKAVRKRLEAAQAHETVNGQLALELARRAVDQSSPLVAMSKELDARITAALVEAGATITGGASGDEAAGAAGPAGPGESDEVKRAREARDRKRAAAREAPAG